MGRNLIRFSIFSTLIILLVMFSTFVAAQSQPPNDGNWVIDETVTVNDKQIVLNGDLIIENGGELNLYNIDLKFNCKSDREYKIKVENGGSLNIYDSKISSNTNNLYVINVDTDGKFNIYNSTIIDYTTYDIYSVEEELMMIVMLAIIIILIVVIILIFVFYRISKRRRKIMTTTIESLVGKTGSVVKTVKPNNYNGNVRVESQIWSATSNTTLHKNEKIKVVDTKGINLIVEKLKD